MGEAGHRSVAAMHEAWSEASRRFETDSKVFFGTKERSFENNFTGNFP